MDLHDASILPHHYKAEDRDLNFIASIWLTLRKPMKHLSRPVATHARTDARTIPSTSYYN